MVTIFVSSVAGNLAPRIRNASIPLAFLLWSPGNAILLNGVSRPRLEQSLCNISPVRTSTYEEGEVLQGGVLRHWSGQQPDSPAAFPKRLEALYNQHSHVPE